MNDKHKFVLALMIITCIAAILMISFITLSVKGVALSSEGHSTVTQIITALIAIVSMIVGANNQNKNKP